MFLLPVFVFSMLLLWMVGCPPEATARTAELAPLDSGCGPADVAAESSSIIDRDEMITDCCNKCDEGIYTSWQRGIGNNLLPDRPLVLNVGANHGQLAQAILDAMPSAQVHSFELMPPVFEHLAKSWKRRIDLQKRWKVFRRGMSAVAGVAKVLSSQDGKSEGGTIAGKGLGQGTLAFNVTVGTVAEYILAELPADSHIDLLQVDAEGFDPAVVFGAHLEVLRSRISMLVFEYGGTWHDERNAGMNVPLVEFVRMLRIQGYFCHMLGTKELYPIRSTILDPWLQIGPHRFNSSLAASPNFWCIRHGSRYYGVLESLHSTKVKHSNVARSWMSG
jgi:FkbM family methyltransferase